MLAALENSTIADYEREHRDDIQPEVIDAECEAMAAEMLDGDGEAIVEWLREHAAKFLPAIRAARRGDKDFAAQVLNGIARDWQDHVVDSDGWRTEAAERVSA
jgi:hypothetical protein